MLFRSTAPISPRWWHALNERERDVREGERTEDERMGWIFCERKRERTAPERVGVRVK